ncbi:MAG: DUF2817 domain-containing protein [Sedimentisphaerales bacterium]|jgi:protein MpaA|nr:DUF2817 domain-containing protein [Sedimentisphaerales bacterium]NLZ05933.1 murein peptide amidase A [Phycisphaerae bacterium]HNY79783.1 DUF2817 domain-containing protein [Sedimentisphaerales bacterium]HOC62239.1 DUF2817 domain-containing protein [Sedimentisphaerales bacterium]HOH63120.1 DUF2817 domain-containing protein [Sedimentisphaerales bacterium]
MDKGRSIWLVCTLLLAVVALAGCYEPEPRPRVIGEDRPVPLPTTQLIPQYRLLGRSIQGRAITAQILGDGLDTTLIVATIHGNEPAGTPLVKRLADHLATNPDLLEGRRIVIIPVANPDGMAAGTRENVRAVDLNRNFEASNRVNNGDYGHQSLSEPETRALQAAIEEFRPNRILSLHQPLNCIDYDGPGKALAAAVASSSRLPVKKLGAKPGSLGAYTGEELGIPTITMELPAAASNLSEDALWERYGQAMIVGITYSLPASK